MHKSRVLASLWIRLLSALTLACGPTGDNTHDAWSGSIDTLPSGKVVVTNTEDPIWKVGQEWNVGLELTIGRAEGSGPDVFGRIGGLELVGKNQLWILEDQAQEIRVFSTQGEYIRTVGRRGGGPGEFAKAVRLDLGPDGNVWVMDRQNARLSLFDSAGRYQTAKRIPPGFLIRWGGFDRFGRYYEPFPVGERELRIAVRRYDRSFSSADTIEVPRDPVGRARFVVESSGGRMVAGVPFQGRAVPRLSRIGTFWVLLTDQYRLVELTSDGDTLRTITRAFAPISVTDADRAQALEDLRWFTKQGGHIDWSKIPSTKPVARDFVIDDEDRLWVAAEAEHGSVGRLFHIFDPQGRFLGELKLPFSLDLSPTPVFRGGMIYGVTRDSLDVPYLIVARIRTREAQHRSR